MPAFIDLTDKRFGHLTVIRRVGTSPYGQPLWECQCDCDNAPTIVFGNALRTGASQSCGCTQYEGVTTHGKTGTPEFTVWQMMIQRTTNPKHTSYADYGGRGITVCDRWMASFEAFLEDMGERPSPEHTLERDDNGLGYCKENCRWATKLEQGRNKRNNRMITFDGECLTASEWSRRTGIGVSTLIKRMKAGKSAGEILSTSSHGGPRIKLRVDDHIDT